MADIDFICIVVLEGAFYRSFQNDSGIAEHISDVQNVFVLGKMFLLCPKQFQNRH